MLGFGAIAQHAIGEGSSAGPAFSINPDGTFTLCGVDPAGVVDSSSIINRAISSIYQSYGGGKLWFPRPGNYLASNIIMKGSVTLHGHGERNTLVGSTARNTDVFQFDSTVAYGGLRDLFAIGYQGASQVGNVINVADNVPVIIRDCHIWGGHSAIKTSGVDGVIENCFIAGWEFASIESHGANWYRRCKIDTVGFHLPNAFYQGTPSAFFPAGTVMENHFEQSDFSGDFGKSIWVADGATATALSVFEGCVISSPIDLPQHRSTIFTGCELGSTSFNSGNGSVSITGSVKLGPGLSVPGASKAGNINIT